MSGAGGAATSAKNETFVFLLHYHGAGSIRSITQAFSVKIEECSSDDRQKLIARVPS